MKRAGLAALVLVSMLLVTMPLAAQSTDSSGSSGTAATEAAKGPEKKDGRGQRRKLDRAAKASEDRAKKDQATNKTDAKAEAKSGATSPEKKAEPAKDSATKAKADAKKEESKEEKKAEKPATYKVRKRPLKIEFELDGIFEAEDTAEVALRAKEWTEFEVLKAVEHGAQVQAGDLLVAIETEKIDRAIADLQRDQTAARMAMQDGQSQLQALEKLQPLEAAASQRSQRVAQEDFKSFVAEDRPFSERSLKLMVKMAEDQLAYEQEELRQLEKMYKADDLVEETEEIVLRRTRDSVERAKFTLERMKHERDNVLKYTLPRYEESLKSAAARQDVEAARSKITIPLARTKLELSLEKMKIDAARSEEKLKRLQADRAAMNIKAPIAGTVYYGRYTRGKWSSSDLVAEKLRRGGRLSNDDVFLTIVKPGALTFRVTLSEKQVPQLRTGQKGYVVPTGYLDAKVEGIIDRVAGVPTSAKDFETRIRLASRELPSAIMAGMTGDFHIRPYENPAAVTIPVSALGSDDQDPRKYRVALAPKDGKAAKDAKPEFRGVRVGKRGDKHVEIVDGLKVGDEILQEYPKEKD